MSVKDINRRNRTFFGDIIIIKDFDPNNIKIDKKSYKNIYLKIYIVNPLYLILGKASGYFEEINGNKY